jgi:RimJ/RimL family protein N-acetyltransferase
MRHDIHLSGFAFSLRPIELDDAELLVSLRGDPELTRFMSQIPRDVRRQEEFLRGYFEREGDYYFVVDRRDAADQHAEGIVAIYDVDFDTCRAEWGRWVIRPRSLAAVESAWMIYRVGFERLGLGEMYCHTLIDNGSVLSFHDKAGLIRRKEIAGFYEVEGRPRDVVQHVLTRDRWPQTSAHLASRAERLAERMRTPA